MIEKTNAICIKISPFSKTSHIVSWLTEKFGIINTVIKGAQRPKSWFIGQYDLFQTCELLFYIRSHNNLHMIKECSPLISRHYFRNNWRAAALASYFCDIISRSTFENTHLPEYYELLTTTLNSLATNKAYDTIMIWFELKFLLIAGHSPTVTNCVSCGTKITPHNCHSFSIQQGGTLCVTCITNTIYPAVTVTPDIIALFKNWQISPSPATATNIIPSAKQILASHTLFGTFISYHLDISPVSRRTAIDISKKTNSKGRSYEPRNIKQKN